MTEYAGTRRASTGGRIAVVGAGGLGGFLAARLARAGRWVAVIARGATLAAIRERGLRVVSPSGAFQVSPSLASGHAKEIGRVDAVILAVKAWQIPDAARALGPLLGPGTPVLTVQNGVEAHEELAAIVGREHVLAGACRLICSATAPGVIRDAGVEPSIALGAIDDGPLSPRAETLVAALVAAGVRVETPPDIRVALWEKLLMIAPFSGAGAVTRSSIGEIRDTAPSRTLLVRIAEEVDAVARAMGVRLAADAVPRTLAFLDSLPAAGTSSMQRDLAAERPSELEAILGAIVRWGDRSDVPTPTVDFAYASLLPQERRARARNAGAAPERSPCK